MPKRPSKNSLEDDVNVLAFRVVQQATNDETATPSPLPEPDPPREKNAAAVALGRLGGKKGGKNRMALLSPEERTAMAKNAAAKRWKRSDA